MRGMLLTLIVLAFSLPACSTYDPFKDCDLRKQIGRPFAGKSALKVTFLGNTTLAIDDGQTTLLVDGFLSRPGKIQTLLSPVGPAPEIIIRELSAAGIHRVDAVLVGHAHHDHALDSTAIADLFGAKAIGSSSYAKVYQGSHIHGSNSTLVTIPSKGGCATIGQFTVKFKPSAHVAPCSFAQKLVEGEIKNPLKLPAYFTQFKCGDVFALHISH